VRVVGEPINRERWPAPGAHRRLLELFDRVHRENGVKSRRGIAEAMRTNRDTVSKLLTGEQFPVDGEQAERLVRALGGSMEDTRAAAGLWSPAHAERIRQSTQRGPAGVRRSGRRPAGVLAGVVRVGAADPRLLGVHAAIEVPGAVGYLPAYVERDIDTDPAGLRARLRAAAERGGFVLVVGTSSAGKTRSLLEAIRAAMPDWWLVHPAGPDVVRELAGVGLDRSVVWLDELQTYLGGAAGVGAGTVRELLAGPGRVVVAATVWPSHYSTWTGAPPMEGPDTYAVERQVLSLAEVVTLSADFSTAETGRARRVAEIDRRVGVALDTAGYGLTQTLAAAPHLVARWDNADPYAKAVLAAAVDVTRLGLRAPIPADLLRAAASGYCTPTQQARAPGNWFETALAYATTELRGATAALTPTGSGMGQVAGYTVADYLQQHAANQRRAAPAPATVWEALVAHPHQPADAERLADSAERRLLYGCAISLYQQAAETGARKLADLLAERGGVEELRGRADTGDPWAADRLANLLADQGEAEEVLQLRRIAASVGSVDLGWPPTPDDVEKALQAKADSGDRPAGEQEGDLETLKSELLARVEAERSAGTKSQVEELRAWADSGDWSAAVRLAKLLAERGEVGELRARADSGDRPAAVRLAGLLAARGEVEELRARADSGDRPAAEQLAKWLAHRAALAERGDMEELQARADAGDWPAAIRLAELLAKRGEVEKAAQMLRAGANAGDLHAAGRLAELLAKRLVDRAELVKAWVHWAELMTIMLTDRAEAADQAEAWAEVAGLGDMEKLRTRAYAGDRPAAIWLADLLAGQGEVKEAAQLLRAGADAGDPQAAGRLAELLAEQSAVAKVVQLLRAGADVGDWPAAIWLANLLAGQGELEEALQLLRAGADAGDWGAAVELAKLLAQQGDVEELRARADTDDLPAAIRLAGLLVKRGDVEELRAWADTRDPTAASALAELLAERGEVGEVRARAYAGDWHAGRGLADALDRADRADDAERVRRFGLNPDGSIASRSDLAKERPPSTQI
jgi:thioredoxin-like negative regulator of GroEL